MFRSLVFRGLWHVLVIFNNAKALPSASVQLAVDNANRDAEKVWKDESKSLLHRKRECHRILGPILELNRYARTVIMEGIPVLVGEQLSDIFTRNYGEADLLLIGRTTEGAYHLQERYAREVTGLLGAERDEYASRAILYLGKLYSRSSLPLLCGSSVAGMWRLCQTSYYKKQLWLVSPIYILEW
jgi:hypothetical protein